MNSNLINTELGDVNKLNEHAIREELSRLLESSIFAQSGRLARFLRFTVETTLAGNSAALKEYLIGTEVYDRKPPYHPSADSIVRSEARRLRNKLRQYYESVGKDDPVFIYYRTGSYVPAFRSQHINHSPSVTRHRDLNQLLVEALTNQTTFDLRSTDRKLDVQIVFEGTIRIVRTAPESSVSAAFPTRDSVSRGQRSQAVVPMAAKKAAGG